MKTEIKTMELYVSPMKERNIDKYGRQPNQCKCCGRLIKNTEYLSVNMGVDWLAYNTNEIETRNQINYFIGTDVEIQGSFSIGNDCAKKMKGFTFKN